MTDKVIWLDSGFQPAAIGFVPSEKAWKALMRKHGITKDYPCSAAQNGTTTWLENDVTGESMILVCLTPSKREPIDTIMTLVHEAVHVWQFACENMGEKSAGIEIEAYAIQHIARNLIEAYTKISGSETDKPRS